MAYPAILLLLTLLPTALAAADLDARLAGLARPAPAATSFVEVRWSKLLATPLITRGRLEYLGPGRLAKYVEVPYREQVMVDGDRVSITSGDEPVRRFSLARAPELRALLGSFSALLAGDRAALEIGFTLVHTERAEGWSLVLTPRDGRTRARILALEVHGRAYDPTCLLVAEPDGDASVLLFDATLESVPAGVERAAVERRCRTGGT